MSFASGQEVAPERHPAKDDLALIQAETKAEASRMQPSAVRKERQARNHAKNVNDDLIHGALAARIPELNNSGILLRALCACSSALTLVADEGKILRGGCAERSRSAQNGSLPRAICRYSGRNQGRSKSHAAKRCPQAAPGTQPREEPERRSHTRSACR